MKVEEVIVVACNLIGENAFVNKITSGAMLTADETEKKNKLLRCFNFIQSEIATEFFPLIAKEKVSSLNGEFELSKLSKNLVYVVSLKSRTGENIKFKLHGRTLVFEGEGELEYCYDPKEALISDDVVVCLPARVIAYGLLREYYLLEDMPTEASLMEEKFKSSILAYSSNKRNINTPKPLWI